MDMGDADYIYAMSRVIIPIAVEFDPDLVIISSGFDAAEGDPIGGYHLTPNAYGYLTHMMKMLANGNLVVVMEGGYNLDSIAKSALAVAKVLVGEVPGRPKPPCLSQEPSKISTQSFKPNQSIGSACVMAIMLSILNNPKKQRSSQRS